MIVYGPLVICKQRTLIILRLLFMQMLMRYVAAAWRRAQDMMKGISASESAQPASGSTTAIAHDPQAITQCLEAFRRAAGAANYLADTLLPQASEALHEKQMPECALTAAITHLAQAAPPNKSSGRVQAP